MRWQRITGGLDVTCNAVHKFVQDYEICEGPDATTDCGMVSGAMQGGSLLDCKYVGQANTLVCPFSSSFMAATLYVIGWRLSRLLRGMVMGSHKAATDGMEGGTGGNGE